MKRIRLLEVKFVQKCQVSQISHESHGAFSVNSVLLCLLKYFFMLKLKYVLMHSTVAYNGKFSFLPDVI